MNSKFLIRVLVLTLASLLIEALLTEIFQPHFPWKDAGWVYVSNFLIVLVMALVARHAAPRGPRRMFLLWVISWVIGSANILIEALVFYLTQPYETLLGIFVGLVRFGILSALIAYVFKESDGAGTPAERESRGVFGWVGRIAACVFLYLIVYFIAGITLQLAIPNLLEYYGNKVPPVDMIVGTQLLRGLVFSGIAILFLNTCTLEARKKTMLLGVIFAVVGGIAPLIPPNELMHQVIRIGHGFEVGISNFLYGWAIGLMLDRKKESANLPNLELR